MTINEFLANELWTEAVWINTGFMVSPDLDTIPGIALIFENEKAAGALYDLFTTYLVENGPDSLRVSILQGKHPKGVEGYSVIIGASPAFLQKQTKDQRLHLVSYRFKHKQTRGENQSLNWFESSYQRFKEFFITFGLKDGSYKPIEAAIRLSDISIRDYSEVKEGDLDSFAVV